MRVIGSNVLEIWEAPPSVLQELRTRLTLKNPIYEEKIRRGGNTEGVAQVISYFSNGPNGELRIPRGTMDLVRKAAARARTPIELVDDTLTLQPDVMFSFQGDLRIYQIPPAAEAVSSWSNVLHIPTGGGKTVIALWIVAHRCQPTLVLVPTVKLMHQWIEGVEKFLGIPAMNVGRIGDGEVIPRREITIGVADSVAAHLPMVTHAFGHLIVDECHRAPGERLRGIIEAIPARYRLGLSATPWRRDGLGPAVQWLLGPTIKVEAKALVELGAILPADIDQRVTGFDTEINASDHYASVMDEIVGSQLRNNQIAADIGEILFNREPGIVLVLCDRRAHCRLLEAYLERDNIPCAVMVGGLGKRKAEAFDRKLRAGELKVIVATSNYLGEGWDFPAVGTLVLAAPVKFSGKLIQGVGRALRPAPGMTRAKIIDYVDSRVGVLLAAARSRLRTYKEEIVQCE